MECLFITDKFFSMLLQYLHFLQKDYMFLVKLITSLFLVAVMW